jgi:hypothetical protein
MAPMPVQFSFGAVFLKKSQDSFALLFAPKKARKWRELEILYGAEG